MTIPLGANAPTPRGRDVNWRDMLSFSGATPNCCFSPSLAIVLTALRASEESQAEAFHFCITTIFRSWISSLCRRGLGKFWRMFPNDAAGAFPSSIPALGRFPRARTCLVFSMSLGYLYKAVRPTPSIQTLVLDCPRLAIVIFIQGCTTDLKNLNLGP
jgi:hypothetical protein